MSGKIIAIANQKGGVGKTTTVVNLSTALKNQGKRVLMVDIDPQANLSMCMGITHPDELPLSISNLFSTAMDGGIPADITEYIREKDGVQYIPSNIFLATTETKMITAISREYLLREILSPLRSQYDYIIIDCPPSLQILTINALAACDSVIIPVQANYFGAKGLELLLQSFLLAKKKTNPAIEIEGILFTMYDSRTNFAKKLTADITAHYGGDLRIFENMIPVSIKATEGQEQGKDIFEFAPGNKIALGYSNVAKELIGI